MSKKQRRAFPANEKSVAKVAKAITANNLDNGGKLNSASISTSGILDDEDEKQKEIKKEINVYVPLIKANTEEQTVTGIVLQPEITDAQGDIMDADVIRKAAHNFLAKYNNATKLGLQHNNFTKNFELYESFIAPQDLVINNIVVKSGSWVMVVKVISKKIWDKVKEGKLTGFSIGGQAKVKKVEEE